MKLRRVTIWLAVAFAIELIAVGTLSAQATGTTDRPTELTNEENLSLIDEDISALTDQQKLDRAAKKIEQMRSRLAGTDELLQTVRDDERDILKINCINENLAAIKGFVKVSEQSYINLQSAINNGDSGAADHHYTLISVAHQKVRELSQEARLCTGEESRFTGDTEVDVQAPESGAEEIDEPDDEYLYENLPELTPYR